MVAAAGCLLWSWHFQRNFRKPAEKSSTLVPTTRWPKHEIFRLFSSAYSHSPFFWFFLCRSSEFNSGYVRLERWGEAPFQLRHAGLYSKETVRPLHTGIQINYLPRFPFAGFNFQLSWQFNLKGQRVITSKVNVNFLWEIQCVENQHGNKFRTASQTISRITTQARCFF